MSRQTPSERGASSRSRDLSPLFERIRQQRLFGPAPCSLGALEGESNSSEEGASSAPTVEEMAAVRAAANRQKAWEDKLEDDAFLTATITPIVDGLVAMKPAVPYAMRQALRLMKKTIHFKDNTYGPGGAVGDPELSAQFAYDHWDMWAQLPVVNAPEQNEGLTLYIEALAWSSFISHEGTDEERNDARTDESSVLSFVHMEDFRQLDKLRATVMMKCAAAYKTLKAPAAAAAGVPLGAMKAEKPEKLAPDMGTLELIEELKTRLNGEDMSWDSFKHAVYHYPGIKVKFNNYLNKSNSDAVWKAKSPAEQVRQFLTEFLDGFDDPGVRARESCEAALRFKQKATVPVAQYLEAKGMRFDEAIREGNSAGYVNALIMNEPERCRNAVANMIPAIQKAVNDHLCEVSLTGGAMAGYQMDHFDDWDVMCKQVRRLAIQKQLDPVSSSRVTPYSRNMMKGGDSSDDDASRDKLTPRQLRRQEARAAAAAEGEKKQWMGPMPCYKLPNQKVFKEGDGKMMPPRRTGGPPNNMCVYFWHFGNCSKGVNCDYGFHITKAEYDKNPDKYKSKSKPDDADKYQAKAAAPAPAPAAADMSTLEAKFDSFHKIMTQISAAQQETSAAVEEFKKERAKAEALHKKESEARKARYQQAHLASMASRTSGGSSAASTLQQLWDNASEDAMLSQLDDDES